jgi:ssRNA-specific RNase YbeY (16S rRNA maturation enzyme)
MEAQSLTVDLVLEGAGFAPALLESVAGPLLRGRIELVVADPGYMRVMNFRFRHVDLPTDVLSFDLRDDPGGDPEGVIYVDGRVYPPLEELLERVFHGYLHLCGRTHDSAEDADAMESETRDMVKMAMEGASRAPD